MLLTSLQPWIATKLDCSATALTRDRIAAYQLAKLRETIDWAQTRSAFYRSHLAGFSAADLPDLSQLAEYPFTTAADLSRNPLALLCVSQDVVSRVVTLQSSGTSGDPKRIYFSEEDQELTIDFFHHGMMLLAAPGDRVLILLPGGRPGSVADLLVKGLARSGAQGIHHGPVVDSQRTLQVLGEERATVLVGIPTQVLALARASGGGVAVKSVLLSTDHVPEVVVEEIQRLWGCKVYAHYGMTEMGFGGGVQCQAQGGYHMREADLYFEIVDPHTGAVLPDGESGEVVFTTLTRRGMPLIRYRTGDVTHFMRERCTCGTILKTMAPVKSRIAGQIELMPGVGLTLADLDEALFAIAAVVDFEASLTRRQNRDCLQIEAALRAQSAAETVVAIGDALGSIPAVREAMAADRLTTSITTVQADGRGRKTTAKRVLADLREKKATV